MVNEPEQVIAEAIIRPPQWPGGAADRPGVDCTAVWWAHLATMSGMGGPALARHIAAAAISALDQAGWVIVPAAGALPTSAQVRQWLLAHDWRPNATPGGSVGKLWDPPPGNEIRLPVMVPHDDDPDLIAGTIRRVAAHLQSPGGQVTREMLLCDDGT